VIHSRGPLGVLSSPALSQDGAGRPYSEHFSDAYYSADGGLAETQHVFLEGCAIAAQLRDPARQLLTVGELGFGTGLNFLATWQAFREHRRPGQRLHFWSVDRHPLSPDELASALGSWPELAALSTQLISDYPPRIRGQHRRSFDGGRVVLDLVWSDAADALAELTSHRRAFVDAWYLDGFSPARNPAMWEPALLARLARCSRAGARAASYSAAGAVRRALGDAGFAVRKRPGFGHKRECIEATLIHTPPAGAAPLTPWDQPRPPRPAADIMVVGAGLAGAHAAAALARRGLQVTVLDREGIAEAASGNAQGVLFSRLSHQHSTLADFSLLAQGYAAGLYQQLFDEGRLLPGRDGDLEGCLQLPGPRADLRRLQAALAALPEHATLMEPDAAAAKLGVIPSRAGFWQPRSGWLSPPAVCRALLQHPAIRTLTHCGELRTGREGNRWLARDAHGKAHASADLLVVAAACDSPAVLPALAWLPLRVIRGQTTTLPADGLSPLLAPLCHEGYVAPAVDGSHCIGATFSPGEHNSVERGADHRENLQALARALPDWREVLERRETQALAGRVALRTSTPDYLPMVGPVPAQEAFLACYGPLASDARRIIDQAPPLLEQCYLSTGFGSRGLSYAALAGELLASQILGEAPPVSRELQRAVSPARFLIRALVRGETAAADLAPDSASAGAEKDSPGAVAGGAR
jgi:tRNA 5-methylaminomethyl-2-thiouridine biosynthesis bifunctional protein